MKQHTIIFVPHARAKFRKWQFSTSQVYLAAATLLALTVGGCLALFSWLGESVDNDQLAQIEAENAALREVNEGFEASIRDLEEKVEDYQTRIHKLAIVAGLTELSPSAEAGIGGAAPLSIGSLETGSLEPKSPRAGLAMDLDRLEDRLLRLDEGMSLVQEKLSTDHLYTSSIPAITPAKGLLTSGFGHRNDPFTGKRAFHPGIDIIAPRGQEIRATGDGIVTLAGWNRGLGKAVSISHGFGVVTRYGHMSKIAVEAGEKVRRGDVIGFIGSTGRSTGVHVHYEVWVEGKAQNPMAYMLDKP